MLHRDFGRGFPVRIFRIISQKQLTTLNTIFTTTRQQKYLKLSVHDQKVLICILKKYSFLWHTPFKQFYNFLQKIDLKLVEKQRLRFKINLLHVSIILLNGTHHKRTCHITAQQKRTQSRKDPFKQGPITSFKPVVTVEFFEY
jgi:hypothetical protein